MEPAPPAVQTPVGLRRHFSGFTGEPQYCSLKRLVGAGSPRPDLKRAIYGAGKPRPYDK